MPAPTRRASAPAPPRPTRAGRSRGNKMWISMGNVAERRPGLRPDRSRQETQGPRLLPGPDRERRLQLAGDPRQARAALVRHGGDLARRGRGRRGRDARRGRRRLQGRDERPRQRPLQRGRRLRRDLRRLRRRLGRLREGAPAVRRADRELPARAGADRRHDREAGRRQAAGLPRRRAQGPRRSQHGRDLDRQVLRDRGGGRLRQRRRSRCTADPATSTTTRSSATSATPGSPPSTRAPPRSTS